MKFVSSFRYAFTVTLKKLKIIQVFTEVSLMFFQPLPRLKNRTFNGANRRLFKVGV